MICTKVTNAREGKESELKKSRFNGRRLLAGILSFCLVFGMMAGSFVPGMAEKVSGATAGFTSNDFLKCNGTSIRNNYGKGNNVYLRGTNAGGLFVQESWMCSTSTRDQKTIMSNLKSRFGESEMYNLLDYYEDNYWTESDFDNCKEMGMSAIRVPFTYMNLYRYDSSKNDWVLRDNAFKKLDWFIEECSKRGIYVILDLHGAFGSQNGQDHSGEVIDNVSEVTFFSNGYNKNKTLELWKKVAVRYANNPAVAAYDTLNEPGEKAGTTGSKHWAFYNDMYNAIRSVDKNHIIIMESCWGTSKLPNPKNYGWTNVMYEYHHYTWNYINDLAGQKNSCESIISSIKNANYGVPTYIGEFTCFGLEDAWNYVMNRFNEEGIHYTSWSYKTNNSGSWGIYNEKNTNKVNPKSDSKDTIRNNWGANSVGTGSKSSNGMVYNAIKKAMPGTTVFAEKDLNDNDYLAIKAQISNKYVCADNNGQSNLIANRTSAGGWEQFRVIKNSDGTISLQSRANNKYLCAVFDDTDKENPIIARSNEIGTWEKFYAEKQADGTYALRTLVNNYYVQVDINDTTSGILHACGTAVGTWEKLILEPASSETVMPGTNKPSEPETTTEAPTTEMPTTVAPTTVAPTTEVPTLAPTEAPTTKPQTDGNLISKNKSVTVSGSESDVFSGKNLVDGDEGTRWSSDFSDNAWAYIDLGKVYEVSNVVLKWEAAYGKDYRIEVSNDGTNWTTAKTLNNQTGGNTTIAINTNAKYVKLQGIKRALPYGYSLWEMEVYGNESMKEPEVNVDIPSTMGKYGKNFKAVAYYPNWYGDITSTIQWDKLTTVIYSFALPNASGVLDSVDGSANVIKSLITAAHNNDTKVEMAVGGWSYSDGTQCQYTFEKATNTDAKCKSLANSILSVVDKYGFDGVDIDWEYPTASSASQFTSFMRYLREGLTQRGLTLSSAVAANSGTYQTDEVLSMVDWINVMAYDGNEGSGHSPYSLITDSFKYWNVTRKVDASKIVLGVPFYERPNWASYADIVAKDSANAYKDSAVINGTTVYYNGLNTMAKKASFAAENAGGIMIWEISQDSKNADYSLLNQIYKSATAVVGTGGKAIVTQLPGTVKVDSFGDKTKSITINNSGNVTYAGNLNNGSYLDYYIRVPEKGNYTIDLNLAAGDSKYNAKNIIVKLNDNAVSTKAITASSSWTEFISHKISVNFTAKGTYKLTLVSDGGACNIGDFSITKSTQVTPVETTKEQEVTKAPETTKEQVTTKVSETTKVPTTVAQTTKAPETTKPQQTTTKSHPTTSNGEYPTWDASTVYVGGDYVSCNGHVYKAKWWTKGDDPEKCGQWDVWQKIK